MSYCGEFVDNSIGDWQPVQLGQYRRNMVEPAFAGDQSRYELCTSCNLAMLALVVPVQQRIAVVQFRIDNNASDCLQYPGR